MRKVTEYLTQLQMEVGVSKCGVTVFHGCIDNVSRRQWQLQGKDMLVVEKYRHLGIALNTSLSKGFIMQREIQTYLKRMQMATPFLSNSRIPMDLHLPVVKSFWALKGGYTSTTCQAFEFGVESNVANGGRSAYETHRTKYSCFVYRVEYTYCRISCSRTRGTFMGQRTQYA